MMLRTAKLDFENNIGKALREVLKVLVLDRRQTHVNGSLLNLASFLKLCSLVPCLRSRQIHRNSARDPQYFFRTLVDAAFELHHHWRWARG